MNRGQSTAVEISRPPEGQLKQKLSPRAIFIIELSAARFLVLVFLPLLLFLAPLFRTRTCQHLP